MLSETKKEHDITIQLKYVPTSDNPADLLTHGLSFETFCKNQEFWLKGPEWVQGSVILWPASDFKCLNLASKIIVMQTFLKDSDPPSPIVSFQRYSSFDKLVHVTSTVLRACANFSVRTSLFNEKTL